MKILVVFVLIVVVLAGVGIWYLNAGNGSPSPTPELSPSPTPVAEQNNNLVGGDKDEHGCIGSAGYSWCEAKSKCLRIWEEACN